jgi:hypothetical protein
MFLDSETWKTDVLTVCKVKEKYVCWSMVLPLLMVMISAPSTGVGPLSGMDGKIP